MSWDCPLDLKDGDEVEVLCLDDKRTYRCKVRGTVRGNPHARELEDPSHGFVLQPKSRYFVWRRLAEPLAPAVTPTKYGATCTRCNEYNEYAAAVAGFVCYGCRR